MDKLLKILQDIKPNVDFTTATDLIGVLTSLDIVRLVMEINDEFDVEITPLQLVPENFRSAETIMALINKLQDED